jgi:dUTP pyrophosphatase
MAAQIKVVKKDKRVELPKYESSGASGLDLRAFLDADITIKPLQRVKVPTGLKMEIPAGYEGQVRPRSGLAIKYGLTVLNSPGTIDSDYRGEIEIILINLSADDVIIRDADRIAQLVIAPVCQVKLLETDVLGESGRGSGGFGSTNIK